MSAENEAVVRRFYEQMNNERKNDLASELFTTDHVLHDPQVPAAPGPQGMADVVSVYQVGVKGHWNIEEIFSSGDRVVVRWTGSGTHVGEGTGLGLDISYRIVVRRHHGDIRVQSTPGDTRFEVLLPIEQPGAAAS